MTSLVGLLLALLLGGFVTLMLLANALIYLVIGCLRDLAPRRSRRPGTRAATTD